MDDPAPLREYSGYATEATVVSDQYGLAQANGASAGRLCDGTHVITFDNKVIDLQSKPFSLSVVFTPVNKDGLSPALQGIALSSGTGLTMLDTTISFTTAYTVADDSVVSYDLGEFRKVHVVGIHTPQKNILFIDGESVAEIDLTPAQQVDVLTKSAIIKMGGTTSGRGIVSNNFAQFNYALSKDAIQDIRTFQNRRAEGSVAKSFGAKEIYFHRGERAHYLERVWDSGDDYGTGVHDGTTVDGDWLTVQKDENALTIAGVYRDSLSLLHDLTAEDLDSVNMTWTGKNVRIMTSIDAVTWVQAVKGRNLSNIAVGFDTDVHPDLYIRVEFMPGVTDAYITDMRVDGYLTSTVIPLNGERVRTFVNAVNLGNHQPAEYSDDWGVHCNGGSVTISSDTGTSPDSFKTIEIWLKTITAVTISASVSSGTAATYTNAIAGTSVLPGQWMVYHFTYAAAINPTFTISGTDFSLGKIAMYPQALTATEVATVIKNYTGIQSAPAGTATEVTVSQTGEAAKVYAHDWISANAM